MATTFEQLKTKDTTKPLSAPTKKPTSAFQSILQKESTQRLAQQPVEEKIEPKKKSVFGKVASFLAPTTTGLITGEKELTARSALGAGLEIGSFFIPAGAVAKGIGLGGKLGIRGAQAIRAAKGAQKGLTLGQKALFGAGVGATTGATFQAGQAIAEPEAGLGDIARRTATGAVYGGAFGAGLPVAGRVAGKTLRKVAERAPEQRLGEMTRNLRTLQNVFEEGVRKTKVGGKVVERSNPIKTITQRKLVPEVINGRTDTTKIVEALTNELETVASKRSPTIAKSTKGVTVRQFAKDVEKIIKSSKELKNTGQITSTLKKANAILKDFRGSFGTKLKLQNLDDIRVQMNRRFDPEFQDTFRAIGDAARSHVYRIDKLSRSTLQHEGELLAARRFAEALNNRPVKGGILGGYVSTILGAMVGGTTQIPVAGPIFGAFGGRALDRAIRDAYFKAPGAKTAQRLLNVGQRADEAIFGGLAGRKAMPSVKAKKSNFGKKK